MGLLGRHRGTFAVGDALVGLEGRGLGGARDVRGLLAGDGPGVEQIQVTLGFRQSHHVVRVGQAGRRVFRREAGNVVGRLHGLRDGRRGKVGGAGIAAPLTQIDRDAQGLVAVALDVLQLALAHRDRQATALGDFGARGAGANLPGVVQGLVHQALEGGAAVAEAALRCGRRIHGGQ